MGGGKSVTNSNDRLDRIENDLETVKDILIAVARRAEATDERMERLAQRTDERINRLAEQQERTQTQLDQLSGKVDQLSKNVDIAFQTITLLSNNTDRTLASINASIQRQDRILDYLLRDRNGNGDGPQP
jgi:archaellum component FlaC